MTTLAVSASGLMLSLSLGLLVLNGCDDKQSPQELFIETTDKPFNEVIEDLEFAITERNYRIVNTLQIGKAIRERGHERFPDNSVILFCNLTIARAMLMEDPDYLNHCPSRIGIRASGESVMISAHLFPESGYNRELDELIRKSNTHMVEIVNFGARAWLEVDDPGMEFE